MTTACASSETTTSVMSSTSSTDAELTEPNEAESPAPTYYAATPDSIGFIDCVGTESVIEPETVTVDCINNSDPVKWMAWRIWNDERAVGWGRLNGKKVVKIELSQPVETVRGERVFSKVSLDGTQLYR